MGKEEGGRQQSKDSGCPSFTSGMEHSAAATTGHQPVFPDRDKLKELMRQQMSKPEYDVTLFYHKTGFCQFIAAHHLFEKTTLCIIALNAVWIAVDTDYNHAATLLTALPIFQVAEHFFCIYFLFEWTMRFLAFRRKKDGLRDSWFVFDSLLVFTMVFETWFMTIIFLMLGGAAGGNVGDASIMRMARLLRLTRMARMARLLRAMPELLILIKGMLAAMRSVAFTLVLLILIIYVFGIAFTQLCTGEPCAEDFGSVSSSMHLLLVQGALMDELADLIAKIEEQSIVLLLPFYVFFVLAALLLMNMLIGVICEVVSAVAATERESMNLAYVREKIQELLDFGDQDGDCEISKAEFMNLLQNKKAVAILQDVGVDVFGVVDFIDYIFAAEPARFMEDDSEEEEAQEFTTEAKEKSLSFSEFMKVILDLRGSNTATVRDIVDLRRFMIDMFRDLEARIGVAMLRSHDNGYDNGSRSPLRLSSKHLPTRSISAPQLQSEQPIVSQFHHLLDGATSDLLAAHEQEIATMQAETCRLQDLLSRCNGTLASVQLPYSLDTNGKPGQSDERVVPSQQAVEPGNGQCAHGQDAQYMEVSELRSCGKGCNMLPPLPGLSMPSVHDVNAAWVPPPVPVEVKDNGGPLRSIPPNIAPRVAQAPTGWPGKKSTFTVRPVAHHSL